MPKSPRMSTSYAFLNSIGILSILLYLGHDDTFLINIFVIGHVFLFMYYFFWGYAYEN